MAKKKRARAAATASADRIPAEAARAELLDLEGAEHTLAELWKARPVVLVFLRHFG